jgi:ABC-type polysaccharide/polyol phosphate export permease
MSEVVGEARSRDLSDAPVRTISARPSLRGRLLHVWQRRELLGQLIVSDIRVKYKGSALGLFWSMLAPAMNLAIYFLVFSVFLKNGIPNFVIYLFSGLVVWNMFFNSVIGSTTVVIARAGLVKKVSFPREILALSTVGATVVYFFVQLFVLALFLLLLGHQPAWSYLPLLPVALITLYLLTAGVSVLMSGVTVYMRDMAHLVEVLLQLTFWLTPVVYSYENTISPALAGHGLSWLYFINPMTPLVMTFQRIFYGATNVTSTTSGQVLHLLPQWSMAHFWIVNLILLGLVSVFYLVSTYLFGRLETNFESEL